MPSNKVELEKREFPIIVSTLEGFQISCWQKRQETYSIHIFSAVYDNASQLLQYYADVRDYIALYFQSETLELDIERWNMYEFLFIKEALTEEVKQLVEQDKFSTRKFVVDGVIDEITEDLIKEAIINELFNFDVQKRLVERVDIKTHLKGEHAEVMSFLDKHKSDDSSKKSEDNTLLTNLLIKTLGGHVKD